MNILLSGIPEKDRKLIRKQIEDMVSTIFKDGICNVTEINIPEDFISTVNSIHKEKFPDQIYFSEGEKNNLRGKNFNYENDFRVILNKDLSHENLLYTLYHELIHGKYYYNIKDYDYLKYDPYDIVEATSFTFMDEYNTFKETFLKYPKVLNEYMGYADEAIWMFKNFGDPNCIMEQLNIFQEANIHAYDRYMYRIQAILSISMAVIDAFSELKNCNIFNGYLEKYEGKEITFIIQYLHSFVNTIKNNIPTEIEFKNLKQCFNDISYFYDMYFDDEK